ncbi:hypothetical protein Acr_13g0010310 [Actinidia rufa]|uniref:Uncharacterized protein n=1 Tax=Actinidia rufa TaxID=165716 RepID=A0A7J0FLN2_9ERIC|nr:hypothetical protein Acr_13g0010310 [Actinidia rufa]
MRDGHGHGTEVQPPPQPRSDSVMARLIRYQARHGTPVLGLPYPRGCRHNEDESTHPVYRGEGSGLEIARGRDEDEFEFEDYHDDRESRDEFGFEDLHGGLEIAGELRHDGDGGPCCPRRERSTTGVLPSILEGVHQKTFTRGGVSGQWSLTPPLVKLFLSSAQVFECFALAQHQRGWGDRTGGGETTGTSIAVVSQFTGNFQPTVEVLEPKFISRFTIIVVVLELKFILITTAGNFQLAAFSTVNWKVRLILITTTAAQGRQTKNRCSMSHLVSKATSHHRVGSGLWGRLNPSAMAMAMTILHPFAFAHRPGRLGRDHPLWRPKGIQGRSRRLGDINCTFNNNNSSLTTKSASGEAFPFLRSSIRIICLSSTSEGAEAGEIGQKRERLRVRLSSWNVHDGDNRDLRRRRRRRRRRVAIHWQFSTHRGGPRTQIHLSIHDHRGSPQTQIHPHHDRGQFPTYYLLHSKLGGSAHPHYDGGSAGTAYQEPVFHVSPGIEGDKPSQSQIGTVGEAEPGAMVIPHPFAFGRFEFKCSAILFQIHIFAQMF